MEEAKVVVAGATRPFPGEQTNGDLWTVHQQNGLCRIALVDGLGHGPMAAAAAAAAREILDNRADLSPEDSIRACHPALDGSRGAVMLVASIGSDLTRIHYAGIGNVEGRLVQEGREVRLVSYRGIVGSYLPKIRAFDLALAPDWLLVLHTDGISTRFELDALREFRDRDYPALARTILQRWGRVTDDATVVVASPPQIPV